MTMEKALAMTVAADDNQQMLILVQYSMSILVRRYTGSGKTHTVLGSDSEEGLYYKV